MNTAVEEYGKRETGDVRLFCSSDESEGVGAGSSARSRRAVSSIYRMEDGITFPLPDEAE